MEHVRAVQFRRSGRRLLLLALLIVGLSNVSDAVAHDHKVPKAALLTSERRQQGQLLQSKWLDRFDADQCDILFRSAIPNFPRAVQAGYGADVRVRVQKAAVPLEISVKAWRRLDEDGLPRGEAETVPAMVQPYIEQGQPKAWDAVILLPGAEARHFYIALEAWWADEQNCVPPPDLGSQSATWAFHVVRR
jgi:hypothetical protein